MRIILRQVVKVLAVVCLNSQAISAQPPEVYHPTDFYLRLGLHSSATYQEILDAGARLIGLYRARIDQGAKADPIKLLVEAVTTLTDPEKRRAYDESRLRPEQKRVPSYEVSAGFVEARTRFFVGLGNLKGDSETIEIALDPTDIQIGRPEPLPPPRPSGSLVEAVESGDFESLAKKLGRDDILYETPLYKQYLASLPQRFFKKGSAPSSMKAVFEAELHRAQAGFIPGIPFVAPIALTMAAINQSMTWLIIGGLVGGIDVAAKYSFMIARPRRAEESLSTYLEERRKPHFRPNEKSRAPELTKFCDQLLIFDIWSQVFISSMNDPKAGALDSLSNEVETYHNNYIDLYPLERIVIRKALRDQAFAQAVVFRAAQGNILGYTSLLESHPEFWLQRLSEVKGILQERTRIDSSFKPTQQELDGFSALSKRLQDVYASQGFSQRWKGRLSSCGRYYARMGYLARGFFGR